MLLFGKNSKHQRNYSAGEEGCLPLILSFLFSNLKFFLRLLQLLLLSSVTFINKIKNKNQRLLKWILLLQEYNLDIRHVKGKDNIVPDALLRVENV